MRKVIFLNILSILLFTFFFTTFVYARSGCCSHHQGVCGCGCCDGTPLSSTCAPYYPECSSGGSVQQPTYKAPISTPYIPPSTLTPIHPSNTPIPIPTDTPTLTPSPFPTKNNTLGIEIKNITPTIAVQSTIDSNAGSGLLGLLILGGAGYWLYKRRKSSQNLPS